MVLLHQVRLHVSLAQDKVDLAVPHLLQLLVVMAALSSNIPSVAHQFLKRFNTPVQTKRGPRQRASRMHSFSYLALVAEVFRWGLFTDQAQEVVTQAVATRSRLDKLSRSLWGKPVVAYLVNWCLRIVIAVPLHTVAAGGLVRAMDLDMHSQTVEALVAGVQQFAYLDRRQT
jgi:hypothetical protein